MEGRKEKLKKVGEKGFTLIKLTIIMFIFCFVLLGMALHIGLVLKTTIIKDKRINSGVVLLQDKIENLKNTSYDSVVTGSDTAQVFGMMYNRNWVVTNLSNNMKNVQVEVSWAGGSVSGSTTIVSQ